MSELKPCPFCGSEADESITGKFTRCSNECCDLGHPDYFRETYLWNNRPVEDRLRAEVEEVQRKYKLLHSAVNGDTTWLNAVERAEAAEQERDRLRAELNRCQRIINCTQELIDDYTIVAEELLELLPRTSNAEQDAYMKKLREESDNDHRG